MPVPRSVLVSISFFACLLLIPASASAQWYLAGYIGGTHTQNADVSIHQPSVPLDVDFHDVQFISESLQPRRYYGLRLGRLGGSDHRLGYEIELIHMKAIGDTTRSYATTIAAGSVLPP